MAARCTSRNLAAVAVLVGLQFISPAGADANVGVPPCTNYSLYEAYGSFHADARWVGSDPIGAISWLWNIYQVSDRPGPYVWQTFINDKAVTGVEYAMKDDNLHPTFYRYANGKARYNSGDTFSVKAIHTGKSSGDTYVAFNNKCRIP